MNINAEANLKENHIRDDTNFTISSFEKMLQLHFCKLGGEMEVDWMRVILEFVIVILYLKSFEKK